MKFLKNARVTKGLAKGRNIRWIEPKNLTFANRESQREYKESNENKSNNA